MAVPQGRFATKLGDGMLGDLVVISDDPTAVSPGNIGGIEVLATFVDGECRFSVSGTSLPR